jgi:hypothetical protein
MFFNASTQSHPPTFGGFHPESFFPPLANQEPINRIVALHIATSRDLFRITTSMTIYWLCLRPETSKPKLLGHNSHLAAENISNDINMNVIEIIIYIVTKLLILALSYAADDFRRIRTGNVRIFICILILEDLNI